jgi:hypothetical protein
MDAGKRAVRHRGQDSTGSSLLEALNRLNPDVGILPASDPAFRRFGEVHQGFRVESLLAHLDDSVKPADGIFYEPDAAGAGMFPDETLPLQRAVFGGVTDLQAGWLYGRNSSLAALEYHKCAEVMLAGTDMIVFAGLVQDISWPEGTYDLSRVQAFLLPRGAVCEIAPCSLHSTPLHVRRTEGFRCIVVLPRGTRAQLDFPSSTGGEPRLLQGRNTWLIAHSSGSRDASLHLGLKGREIELATL